MHIKVREVKDVAVLDIEGTIDINSAELIETTGWLLKRGKGKLLLNFEKVDLLDYSGLSVLAIAYKHAQNCHGTMKFEQVSLAIQKLLEVAKLTEVFEIYLDEHSAVESFEHLVTEEGFRPLRRRFPRLEVNLSARYWQRMEGGRSGATMTGRVISLSGDGLFIQTDEMIPVGTLIEVEVALPSERAPLKVKGQVVWQADEQLHPQSYPGMGVQLVEVASGAQRKLLDFVDRHMVHRSM